MSKKKHTAKPQDDPAMARVRKLWKTKQDAGWTQQQLGELMGHPAESARKSASQFFKAHDPKVSTLRRFANALGIPLTDLFM